MSFNVGDEVVCVDDVARPNKEWRGPHPVKGRHYIIDGIKPCVNDDRGEIGLVINELDPNWQYLAWRFRKIKPNSIAIFRAMCVSPKPLVPVE